ncbi:hypothetical protein ACVXG7_07395 [Enterobacter hormaechei]
MLLATPLACLCRRVHLYSSPSLAKRTAHAEGAYRDCSLFAAAYFPFGQAYGAPNFNTLLALHSTNMEESTEILTIFPWYNYVVGLFIFALGVIAVRRKPVGKGMGKIESLCLAFSVVTFFVAPVQNLAWAACLSLKIPGIRCFASSKTWW